MQPSRQEVQMESDLLLVAIDPAGCAWAVASRAAELAERLGASAVLQHAVHLPAGVEPGPRALEELQRDAHEQLSATAELFLARGVPARVRIDSGPPAHAILAAAEEEGATMIVVGTHGRSGLARLIIGSVAEAVIRGASVPVLTVRGGPAVGLPPIEPDADG
jgi:nucleotide-binding universal stress UspA family protein